jgi:hypothetical protein
MIIEHGPSVGEYRGRSIPAYIVDAGGARSDFVGIAVETDVGVELAQLKPDECVIVPGLIYKRAHSATGKDPMNYAMKALEQIARMHLLPSDAANRVTLVAAIEMARTAVAAHKAIERVRNTNQEKT